MASSKPAPPKRDYHVLPTEDGWEVKREGNKTASVKTDFKKDATEAGRELAKKAKVELVIHNKNGKIADSDSYGNDPSSVKDKKH